MKQYFLIPYNPEKFDLDKCFAKYGFCEWHQNVNIKPNIDDVCYIYESHGASAITYKCIIQNCNFPESESIDQSDCDLVSGNASAPTTGTVMRLILDKKFNCDELKCKILRKHDCNVFTWQSKLSTVAANYIEEIIESL